MNWSKLKELNVAIVTHVFATGPSQELEEYLKSKVGTLMFIGHPFYYAKDIRSFYRITVDGKLTSKREGLALKLPEPFTYFKDFIYTLVWMIKTKKNFDIFVGVDSLNCFGGIFLKKIKKTRKVIMYTIDYVPMRFNNRSLNWLYHKIDNYCVIHSDQIWNLSPRMAAEREKKGVFKDDKQIVVPIGVNFNRINRLSLEEINRNCVVYMGHLRKGQGLELIIQALPRIVKKIPDVKIIIIGTGPLENYLKNKANELGVSKNVEFKGFIEDHRDVENTLVKCAVGLAMYEPNPDSITQYTDPSKPKQYMACGLPVIITKVPWTAEKIEENAMGIVVDYNEAELSDAIIKLLSDDTVYTKCRENALKFASELDWEKIFSDTFSKLCG